MSSGDDSFLESHRREITVVFCDLRGFTAFAETVEPEDVMQVLSEYHEALGDLVHRFEGTLERFTGDGLMVFFNDPLPCPDAPERAVRMAVAMRSRVTQLAEGWRRMGYDLHLGIGIAQGHATLGRDRLRGPLGLRGDRQRDEPRRAVVRARRPGQILISARVHAGAEEIVTAQPMGELSLRGFSKPTRVYDIAGLDAARTRA